MAATELEPTASPPRDALVRAIFPGVIEMRDIGGDVTDAMPTMEVGFARYDEWTTIQSHFEGTFMERIAPGAFTKTIKENTPNMRALFQHGRDPQIGEKVLGPIAEIRDTAQGPVADVPLLDTSYNRDLLPGLRAGVYGSSFRFKVIREEFARDASPSDYNPDGLPERTILEAKVMECGPVTFPAYEGATAGVRSLTDDFMFGRFATGTDVHAERAESTDTVPPAAGEVTTTAEAEPTHSVAIELDGKALAASVSRDTPTDDDRQPATTNKKGKEAMSVIDEMRERQGEIRRTLEELSSEHQGEVLIGEARAQWDELTTEWNDLTARCAAEEERSRMLLAMSSDSNHVEGGADGQATPFDKYRGAGTGTYVTKRDGATKTPENPFDYSDYTARAQSVDHLNRLYDDGARRAIERFEYPHPDAKKDVVNAHIESVMREAESPDREIARRIILCGSPLYRSAFWKTLAKMPLTADEQRAMAVGAISTGGAAVPVQLDPTLIPTANASLNPLRAISRVFTTTSYVWQGVTSGGITAQYRAEGATMSDNSPTLTQPQIQPERADAFVPVSWELAQDWNSLEANLAAEFQDAKDQLEAVKFAVGAGHSSNEPQGILTATNVAGTIVDTVAGTAFSVADIYKVEAALNARHQANASWVATPGMFNKVRQFDTGGGASLWVQLQPGMPGQLIGYPAYKATNVGTAGPALTATAVWGIFGDFNKFAIVDRVGMSVRMVDNLTSGNTQGQINLPTGQSGVIAFWRNSSGALDSNAFRVGTIATSI